MLSAPEAPKLDKLQRQKVYFQQDGTPTVQMQLHWQRTMDAIDKAFFDLGDTINAVIQTQEDLAAAQAALEETQATLTLAVADIAAAQDDIIAANAAIADLDAAIAAVSGYSGWATYNHGGGALSLPAATRTQLLIDGATKIETQLPADTGPLWASDKFTGRNGDAIVARTGMTVTPSDATASYLQVEYDIGGASPIVATVTLPLVLGSGVAQAVTIPALALFMGATFAANGCKIYLTSDGPCSVTLPTVHIQRTHKAR